MFEEIILSAMASSPLSTRLPQQFCSFIFLQ